MSATCPHCGGSLTVATTAKHRGELERQLGDAGRADALRREATATPDGPPRAIYMGFIAWRGYVWAKVRLRKPARCEYTNAEIPAGAWAWRQLSEVRDRDLRVSAEAPGPWSN